MSEDINLNSLDQPKLYDVYRFLRLYVVGEDKTKMSLFTNWLLAGQNVLLEGMSSSGKTCIMDAVANLIDSCFKITQSSDTAIFYLYEQINKATHIYIPELNKVNPVVIEILKDWGEGKVSKRDVTVIKGKKGKRKFEVDTMLLYPKPFIFSRADENPIEIPTELLNRVTIMNCDSSVDQTKKVLEFQANNAEKPFYQEILKRDIDVRLLKDHVSNLPIFDKYIHPAAGYFKDKMPAIFPTSRRDFPRYLHNTYGIARFNVNDNKMVVKMPDGKKLSVLLITPEDMWLNQRIFGDILLASSIKCTQNEQKILSVIKHEGRVDKNSIQSTIGDIGVNMSLYAINKILRNLENYGYLTKEKEGNKNFYEISSKLGSMEITLDWTEVRDYIKDNIDRIIPTEENTTKYLTDYIDKEWLFIDPFEGDYVNPTHHVDTVKLGDLLELEKLDNGDEEIEEEDDDERYGLGRYV